MWLPAVDQFAIAQEEGIELAPGQYGRRSMPIVVAKAKTATILNLPDSTHGQTEERVRFSLSHELGVVPTAAGHLRFALVGGNTIPSPTSAPGIRKRSKPTSSHRHC